MNLSRDALADQYLNQLPYAPYPVQLAPHAANIAGTIGISGSVKVDSW